MKQRPSLTQTKEPEVRVVRKFLGEVGAEMVVRRLIRAHNKLH